MPGDGRDFTCCGAQESFHYFRACHEKHANKRHIDCCEQIANSVMSRDGHQHVKMDLISAQTWSLLFNLPLSASWLPTLMCTSHGRSWKGSTKHKELRCTLMYHIMGRAYCIYEQAETQLPKGRVLSRPHFPRNSDWPQRDHFCKGLHHQATASIRLHDLLDRGCIRDTLSLEALVQVSASSSSWLWSHDFLCTSTPDIPQTKCISQMAATNINTNLHTSRFRGKRCSATSKSRARDTGFRR